MDKNLSNVWLVAFADARLVKPRRRLMRQALAFGFAPSRIRILTDEDLDGNFKREFGDRLVHGSRGFGYWCWKPYIAIETMKMMGEGDVLFYLDIGCHLNKKGKIRFYDYLRKAMTEGFCAFQARSRLCDSTKPDPRHHVYLNSQYTKGDLFDYFGLRDNPAIVNAAQVVSTAFFMKKSRAAEEFLMEWMDVYRKSFALIDDSPSKSPNFPGFIENRHDQSVFSFLWLVKGYPTFSGCEIEPLRKYAPACQEYRHNPTWGSYWFYQMAYFPIHAKRDWGRLGFWTKLFRFFKLRIFRPFKEKYLTRRDGGGEISI